jgi:phosphoribosyl 1,2-cyclic phosphodiesterase
MNKSMKIKAWGTRGSIPISNHNSIKMGGNTTCYEVFSECLPIGNHLMIDAGTGLIPASKAYAEPGLNYTILFSHYHWDHILGLSLSTPTFIDQIPIILFGPNDRGLGPEEMVDHLFYRPFFPVDSRMIKSKMSFTTLEDFDVRIIAVHPRGGYHVLPVDTFKTSTAKGLQLNFGNNVQYDLAECLIIRMARANHGNSECISYRFEEMPTGKIFVFCTDHENLAETPAAFRRHLTGADLLVIDSQYTEDKYARMTAGFGHGTPLGCIKLAITCGVKKIVLTHHDPESTDDTLLTKVLTEALEAFIRLSQDTSFQSFHKVDQINLIVDNILLASDNLEIEL